MSLRHRFGRLLAILFLAFVLAGCAVQAQIEFETGMDQLRSSQYEEAVQSFTRSLQKAPRFAQAYIRRGEAFHRLGQYERTIEPPSTFIREMPTPTTNEARCSKRWETTVKTR